MAFSTLCIINPNGTTEELKLAKFSSSYLCLIVFQGAFEPLSSTELVNFSENVSKFRALNCEVVGVVRDSTMAVQEWLAQPFGKELGTNAISCISSPGIGDGDLALPIWSQASQSPCRFHLRIFHRRILGLRVDSPQAIWSPGDLNNSQSHHTVTGFR